MSIPHLEDGLMLVKCCEWLRTEASSIQTGANENDIVIIWLFLPARFISGISQRKLDLFLSEVVNRNSIIHRVELRTIVKS